MRSCEILRRLRWVVVELPPLPLPLLLLDDEFDECSMMLVGEQCGVFGDFRAYRDPRCSSGGGM